MSVDAEYIKVRTNLVDLIQRSGVELTGNDFRMQGICPFHEDQTASLKVQPSRQWWWCYACDFGGDIFSWVMRREDCTFRESVQKLANNELGPPIIRKVATPATKTNFSPIPAMKVEEFHETLLAHTRILSWLQDVRHWSLPIIQKHKIGYFPERKRITIPVLDPLGCQYVDIRLYGPNAKQRGEQKMLAWSDDRESRPSMPFDAGGLDATDYCVLVEGEPDALAAESIGIPTLTHTCGATAGMRVWSTWSGLVLAERVLVCYDLDDAGRNSAARVVELFPNGKIVTLPEELGHRGDITDLITLKGAEWTQNFIQSQSKCS